MIRNTILLFSFCIIALSGCFSSTRIYKKEYEKNDSTFVQRKVGAEVFIGLKNSEEYTGELLTVNDSIMFLSFEEGLTEQELISSTDQIYTVQNLNIKSMWIYGENNHLIGLGIGVGLGLAIIKIAANQPKRNDALLIGSIGLLTAVTGIIFQLAELKSLVRIGTSSNKTKTRLPPKRLYPEPPRILIFSPTKLTPGMLSKASSSRKWLRD